MGAKYEVDANGNVTVTKDLTVDTTTLKVDSTNHRVGIGTNAPGYDLEVANGKTVKLSDTTGVLHTATGVVSASNVVLTSEVTGVLPLANGGTNSNTLNAATSEVLRVNVGGTAVESTGLNAPASAFVGVSDAQTLTNKTIATTLSNTFTIGDGLAGIKSIVANNANANDPIVRFNDGVGINKWQYSNNGIDFSNIGSDDVLALVTGGQVIKKDSTLAALHAVALAAPTTPFLAIPTDLPALLLYTGAATRGPEGNGWVSIVTWEEIS